jgi:hypothetical protein
LLRLAGFLRLDGRGRRVHGRRDLGSDEKRKGHQQRRQCFLHHAFSLMGSTPRRRASFVNVHPLGILWEQLPAFGVVTLTDGPQRPAGAPARYVSRNDVQCAQDIALASLGSSASTVVATCPGTSVVLNGGCAGTTSRGGLWIPTTNAPAPSYPAGFDLNGWVCILQNPLRAATVNSDTAGFLTLCCIQ